MGEAYFEHALGKKLWVGLDKSDIKKRALEIKIIVGIHSELD